MPNPRTAARGESLTNTAVTATAYAAPTATSAHTARAAGQCEHDRDGEREQGERRDGLQHRGTHGERGGDRDGGTRRSPGEQGHRGRGGPAQQQVGDAADRIAEPQQVRRDERDEEAGHRQRDPGAMPAPMSRIRSPHRPTVAIVVGPPVLPGK